MGLGKSLFGELIKFDATTKAQRPQRSVDRVNKWLIELIRLIICGICGFVNDNY